MVSRGIVHLVGVLFFATAGIALSAYGTIVQNWAAIAASRVLIFAAVLWFVFTLPTDTRRG
jgi:hypothetical protein